MAKRHETALYMQAGACNPSGIARALVETIDQARADGHDPREDAACKLVLHQLAAVMRMNYMTLLSDEQYRAAMTECVRHAGASVVAATGSEMYARKSESAPAGP